MQYPYEYVNTAACSLRSDDLSTCSLTKRWESMRLIISPLAPRPLPQKNDQSFFVRAWSHPSRRRKSLQILRQFFSLSLRLHSKQSSEKINMHGECTALVKTASIPGTANLIRYAPSSVQLTRRGRRGWGSVRRSRTNRGGPGSSPRPPGSVASSRLPGRSGGRSCSSGLLLPPFCQYRQPKLNKDVY